MSHITGFGVGSVSVPSAASDAASGAWWNDGSFTLSEDAWIDLGSFWLKANSGTVTLTIFLSASNTFSLCPFPGVSVGTSYGDQQSSASFNSGTNNSASSPGGTSNSPYFFLPSGYQFWIGAYTSGASSIGTTGDTSGSYDHLNCSSVPARSGYSVNPFGAQGRCRCWVNYWQDCSISSITSTPVAVGQQFSINGVSFNATIYSIDVNGTAVTSYTVNSDSSITATVPAGATTGPVHVISYAGNATSPTNLTISGAYALRTGVWTPGAGYAERSGVETQASEIAVLRTGVWTPGG